MALSPSHSSQSSQSILIADSPESSFVDSRSSSPHSVLSDYIPQDSSTSSSSNIDATQYDESNDTITTEHHDGNSNIALSEQTPRGSSMSYSSNINAIEYDESNDTITTEHHDVNSNSALSEHTPRGSSTSSSSNIDAIQYDESNDTITTEHHDVNSNIALSEQTPGGSSISNSSNINAIQYEESNDTITTDHNNVNSNSSVAATVSAWRTADEDSASSVQPESTLPSNENSNSMQSINEDSRILNGTTIRKSDSHSDEPPSKVRKVSPGSFIDDGDGETCPICLELWDNSGEHKLVALKCGHLFGSQCVMRWLKGQSTKDRSCPTCKKKATIKDLRYIYARKLVAADTSELTALKNQIEIIQMEKSRTELDLQKTKVAHMACLREIETLKKSLVKTPFTTERAKKSWKFALDKNIEMCKDDGCRVLAYNCRSYELYVSQKSSNSLFPGYGVRKVNCVDYRLGQFTLLHPKPVRDMTYSQPKDLLLSVSLDNTAKIIERNVPVMTVQTGSPLWSCCWDCIRPDEFYVGGVGGFIHQYDIRNTSVYVNRLSSPGDISPNVSLSSTEYGLLSCHLNSSWLWVTKQNQWEPRSLPIEGPFMSLTYDKEKSRLLVSGRPATNRSERSTLSLCKLSADTLGEVRCEVEQTFQGTAWSSLMSRSSLVTAAGGAWAAVYSESESVISLHGLDNTTSLSLAACEPALDMLPVQINDNTLLAALSKSRLRMYKAVSSNLCL